MTIIPIIIGAFGTVTKGLLKGLEDLELGGRVETIQTIALLRTARILRLEETCCHSDSSEKPSANADVKSSNEWIIIIIKSVSTVNIVIKSHNDKIEKVVIKHSGSIHSSLLQQFYLIATVKSVSTQSTWIKISKNKIFKTKNNKTSTIKVILRNRKISDDIETIEFFRLCSK